MILGRYATGVLLLLLMWCAPPVSADSCPGISADTAKRIFDLMSAAPVGEGFHLDGVGTKQAEMEILWSLRGQSCPRIQIRVENCASSPELATLKLTIPDDLSSRCPGLQVATRALAEALANEHPAAQGQAKPPLPWPLIAAGSTIVLAAALIIVRLLMLLGGRTRVRTRWPSPLARAVWVVVPSIALYAVVEIGYRAAIWSLSKRDAADTFVLYGVGESTMVGEPFDERISLIGLVSEMLNEHVGERTIAVHNVAERGRGSYAQSLRFEQELMYRDHSLPGAALIYAGHNEPYLGDSGRPLSATQDERRGSWLASLVRGRSGAFLKRTWLLRDAVLWLRSLHFLWPPAGAARYEWSLRRMIEVAQDHALTPILFTLPSNISGIEPNAYAADAPGIADIIERGTALERASDYHAALALYGENYLAATPNSTTAQLLLYRIAHCEAALGQFDEARRDYWAVVNEDSRLNFGRATVAQNDLIRSLAAEYHVPLVDGVKAFERASPHAILGNELFSDGHHPTLRGYLLLASECAQRMAQDLHTPLRAFADENEVMARFGIGPIELGRAHVGSGSWLIATAGHHPTPLDRLAHAEAHFRAAAGAGDDFSVWFGVALAQAGRNGFLRDADNLAVLGEGQVFYSKSLRIAAEHRAQLIEQLRRFKVEESVMANLESAWP